MTLAIRLRVEGVDISDPATVEAIAVANLHDALWGRVEGVTTATVFCETPTEITHAIREFMRRLDAGMPAAYVMSLYSVEQLNNPEEASR